MLCQRQVTSVASMKNESFGVKGRFLKVALFKGNTTQDFLCTRGSYLLPTIMDRQSVGTKPHDYFWDAYFSKRYN